MAAKSGGAEGSRRTSSAAYGSYGRKPSRAETGLSTASRVTYDAALEQMRQMSGGDRAASAAARQQSLLIELTQGRAAKAKAAAAGPAARKPRTPRSGRRASSARSGSAAAREVEERSSEIMARIQARLATIDAKLGPEPEPEPELELPAQPVRTPRGGVRPASQRRRPSQSQAADFQPAARFDGARLGFEFKNGPLGIGYYRVKEAPKKTPQPQLATQAQLACPAGPAEEEPAKPPSRMSSAASVAPSSRPASSASSLDSEWVFALNEAARNCEIRRQSRMSHRGGGVMTWAEPGSLSPIGEGGSTTPSSALGHQLANGQVWISSSCLPHGPGTADATALYCAGSLWETLQMTPKQWLDAKMASDQFHSVRKFWLRNRAEGSWRGRVRANRGRWIRRLRSTHGSRGARTPTTIQLPSTSLQLIPLLCFVLHRAPWVQTPQESPRRGRKVYVPQAEPSGGSGVLGTAGMARGATPGHGKGSLGT